MPEELYGTVIQLKLQEMTDDIRTLHTQQHHNILNGNRMKMRSAMEGDVLPLPAARGQHHRAVAASLHCF